MAADRAVLGRTGLAVGRLGISAGYGVPAAAVEEAVERGVNYLYWGGTRRLAFAEAVRNLAPRRESFLLVVQSYVPFGALVTMSLERALKILRLDYIDVLLLGAWSRPVPRPLLDTVCDLRRRGLVRYLALSTHKRTLVPQIAGGEIDIFHVRYNAAHRGAEVDIFPRLPERRPGIVSFTATSWRQLLDPRRIPAGERAPTAEDCYRFVLSHPSVDVCMTGPARAGEMRTALAAWEKGPLSPDELAWMRRVGDAVRARSWR